MDKIDDYMGYYINNDNVKVIIDSSDLNTLNGLEIKEIILPKKIDYNLYGENTVYGGLFLLI